MGVEASSAVGPPPGMRIRLSSNESALGPAPAAVAAATDAVRQGHLYPDDQSVALREALAEHEGCAPNEVSVGTGSAALLMDLVAHELGDGGSVVAYERAFIVYRLAAGNAGAPYIEAVTGGPAADSQGGYARDPEMLLAQVDANTRVLIVDNPGNPTGAHLDTDGLRHLVANVPPQVTIVIDEAYHHFAAGHGGYTSVRDLDVQHPRLLVTRTFSKAYGLAGFRVGYLIGPAPLVRSIDAFRPRFNVTAPGQAAALAALSATDHLDATVASAVEGRARMQQWLTKHDVPFTPSLGNFITIETGGPASDVVQAFAARGIGIRPLAPYGMNEQVRVTVGTAAEVDEFLGAAEDILAP